MPQCIMKQNGVRKSELTGEKSGLIWEVSMRRKDREIREPGKMMDILKSCDCCRLGLVDGEEAYIVPLNFGYEEVNGNIVLYFHCAKEGRKIDLLPEQNRVAFEMDSKHEVVTGESACKFSFLYQCIMGTGKLEIIQNQNDRIHGLKKIMEHYSGSGEWRFNEELADRIHVLRLSVSSWTCKVH